MTEDSHLQDLMFALWTTDKLINSDVCIRLLLSVRAKQYYAMFCNINIPILSMYPCTLRLATVQTLFLYQCNFKSDAYCKAAGQPPCNCNHGTDVFMSPDAAFVQLKEKISEEDKQKAIKNVGTTLSQKFTPRDPPQLIVSQ